jgi:hypothetical protein
MDAITDKAAIKAILDEYDWQEAPNYGSWNAEDVAEIIAMEEGEDDGENWLMVVRLEDGRFSFLSAGCDYTGWDCQAGGSSDEKGSLEELIRMGMGQEDRDRLGFKIDA